jgi:hypothetical protein
MEIAELRERYLKQTFDEREFEVDADDVVAFSLAVGETLPCFTEKDDPGFRAPPTFVARFHGRRMLPSDLPLEGRIPLDAGKAVMPQKTIHAGQKLVGRSYLNEIYDKTGRSGRMIFLVSRMELRDETGELASIVDSRLVVRERPDA